VQALVAFQNALVALACDASLRAQFEAGNTTALGSALDDRGRAALRALPLVAIERFAQSLIEKRWSEVSRVIPLARQVCPSLPWRYQRWLSTHPARAEDDVLGPGEREALRALAPLRQELAEDPGEAAYAADVLAHEVFDASSRRDGIRRTLKTRHPLQSVLVDVACGLLPIDPQERRELVVYGRNGPRWEHW
jgi:hypothetical protein